MKTGHACGMWERLGSVRTNEEEREDKERRMGAERYEKGTPSSTAEPETRALLPLGPSSPRRALHTGHLAHADSHALPHRTATRGTRGRAGMGGGVGCQKEEGGRKSRRQSEAGKTPSLITKAWRFPLTTCGDTETLP